jgi:hypothetical protein
MREDVVRVVEKYIESVRRNDADGLPLHADLVWEFPLTRDRGAASFRASLGPFFQVLKGIEVVRLIVDGEHCVAILNIDTVLGRVPFAEHIQVVDGKIVWIRGYCDPRPLLSGASSPA